jgi:predicted acylesterase/phospholipase RssA
MALGRRRLLQLGGGAAAAVQLGACSAPARLAALPERLRVAAPFKDMPADCRVVLDGHDDPLLRRIALQAAMRELDHARQSGRLENEADYLAVSGGGQDGAFGAGLLTEWTSLGSRPEFKAVTGVSTGALIAPFAFLGPAHDEALRDIYTNITQADVITSRGLITALISDSAYDSAPLLRTIRRHVTAELLQAIAQEYKQKGRLLFVATTNLDVPVGVMWNMGAIAASDHPRAADLFSQILLASASIPGLFAPVMIDIETNEGRFQEMHVDGGTVAQVVLYPPSLSIADLVGYVAAKDRALAQHLKERKRRLFIIRNSRLSGQPQTVRRNTLKIAERAIASLIQTQGIGDLYQLYVVAQRDGIDYNVTSIPASFTDTADALFDQQYMRRLFEVGRTLIRDGLAWRKVPPGYDDSTFGQPPAPASATTPGQPPSRS